MPQTRKMPPKPLKTVFQSIRMYKWLLLKVGIVAALVDFLLTQSVQPGAASGTGFWQVAVLALFLWLARQLADKRKNAPSARSVFYDGIHAFLKLFLIMIFWVICLLPFVIGSVIYAQVAGASFMPSTIETIVAAGLWLLLALISIYFTTRVVFSAVLVQETTPIDAIRQSWHITRQRAMWVGARLVGSLVFVLLPSALVLYILQAGIVQDGLLLEVVIALSDALIYVFILPFMALMINQLYEHEKRSSSRRPARS